MGTPVDPAPVRNLADYTLPLRRRWRWVAIGGALGLLLGLMAGAVAHHTYTSTASVLVTPTGVQEDTNNATGRTQSEINLDTEVQILKSDAVAARVRRALHAPASLATIERRVSATVPANTTVIRIAYTAGSPRHAAAGAKAFATSYLAVRALAAERLLRSQEAKVRERIAAVAAEAKQRSATTPATTAPERALRALQYKALSTESVALATQLTTLTTTVVTPGRVIAGATTTSGRSSLVLLLGGMMLGLLFGVGGAVVRDRTDLILREPYELEDVGIRVVGAVDTPRDALRTYTRAANAILGTSPGRRGAVLVAGPTLEPRDDDVAVEVAKAIREIAGSVALVSVEDGSAEMTEVGGRDSSKQAAAKTAELSAAATRGGIRRHVERLKEEVDFVVVNAADPLAEAVLPACDTALLVVSVNATRVPDAVDAAREIEGSGVRVLGAVVLTSNERRAAAFAGWPWVPESRRTGDAPRRSTRVSAADRTSSQA